MPFPESERLIFDENTLVEVICQLRFPPILAIVSEPPAEFQEKIRPLYPLYRQENPFLSQLPSNLSAIFADLPMPKIHSEAVSHSFDTDDSRRTISLASDFVAVSVRDYEQWEIMHDEIERAKSALEEIYQPAFYTRIGLRYQDVVRKADLGLEATPWHELLNPAFTGMLGATPVREDVTEIRSDCVVRVFPDQSDYVKISHGFVEGSERQHYAIDMDFFTTERRDTTSVGDKLEEFNRQAGYLFRWAIEPSLRDALRPRPTQS